MSNVFIICRSKARGNSSYNLMRAMEDEGLNVYRTTPTHVPLRSRSWSDVYVNYGCSQRPVWWDDIPRLRKLLNPFNTVRVSARKTLMQQAFRDADIPCLISTRDRTVAEAWADDDAPVVCRTLSAASRGRGIVIAHNINEVVGAPLYTKLFTGNRVREYRVYLVDGHAVDIAEKRRRGRGWCREHNVDRDSEITNLIRTHGNGWVFARNTFEANEQEREVICRAAERAGDAIGMGIGGVDMIVDRDDAGNLSRVVAVETNTSLGLDRGATTTRLLARGIKTTVEEL